MGLPEYMRDGLYRQLSEKDGIITLFRKFETGTWIAQVKGGKQIGMVLITEEDLQEVLDAPALKPGDGTTPQG